MRKIVPPRSGVKPDIDAAAEFALSLPTKLVHLCAIHPDKTEKNKWGKEGAIIRGKSFGLDNDILEWITLAQRRGFGVYFNINDLSKPLDRLHPKAYEGEVSVVHALHLDADDPKDITDPKKFKAAHAALLKKINAYPLPPSLIIDSGNGFGVFWLLWPAITVTDANRLDIKSRNKALREYFGMDACENLDRVMRLPGTTNFPNAAKIKRGRKAVPTFIVQDDRAVVTYSPADFPLSAVAPIPTSHSGDAYKAIGEPDIPDTANFYGRRKLLLDPDMRDLIERDHVPVGERSDKVFAVACDLRRRGWTDGEIIAVITDPDFAISDHILDQKQRSHDEQASRVIVSMNNKGIVPYQVEQVEDFDD